MRYEIEAGGRTRHVAVSRTGDTFAVTVDGRPYQVDAVRIDAHTLSLIVDRGVSAGPQSPPDIGPGVVYDTVIAPEGGGRSGEVVGALGLVVRVGAVPVTVSLNGPRRRGRIAGGAPGSGPLRIAAPMPGKILRVLVQAGDRVRARQPIVVIEAMKMENELRADRDGTVAEIHAREGISVESGALLVVIR